MNMNMNMMYMCGLGGASMSRRLEHALRMVCT